MTRGSTVHVLALEVVRIRVRDRVRFGVRLKVRLRVRFN